MSQEKSKDKAGSLEQKVEIRGANDRPGFPVRSHHGKVNVVIVCPLDRITCDCVNQESANIVLERIK